MASVLGQHLEKLPAFVTTARLGSITKASKVAAISQAALSQSIQALEQALGVKLFNRNRTGVRLTSAGKVLFRYGEQLVEELHLMEAKIQNPAGPSETLRVGTHEALAIHYWPTVVKSFQTEQPRYSLSIISGRVEALVQQLLDQALDLILTVEPRTRTGLKTQVLYQDEFCFYGTAALNKTLTGQTINFDSIPLAQLSQIPILTDRHSHLSFKHSLLQTLTELGLHGAHHFQLNSFEAAIQFALRGLGIALLPRRIAKHAKQKALKPVRVQGLPEKSFAHKICLSYLEPAEKEQRLLVQHLTQLES